MSMDVHGMQRLARLQLEEVTWTCINTQERTDALEMKKCVFEKLKRRCFFLFNAFILLSPPLRSHQQSKLSSLLSSSSVSNLSLSSDLMSRDFYSNHESWKTGHHLDEAARERRSGKKKKLKLSQLMTQTSLDAC